MTYNKNIMLKYSHTKTNIVNLKLNIGILQEIYETFTHIYLRCHKNID